MNLKYTASTAWIDTLSAILNSGHDVSPRGKKTKELLSYTSVIDMSQPIVTIPERKLNFKFLFGEAYFILSGSNRVGDISNFMNAITKFSDDGITFNGAYGPKVMEQISYVVHSLFKDKDSRQAVISIWRERPAGSKDIPCTLTLDFKIRDGKLNLLTTMRSSDAWLGWVYDVFNFSMIAHYVANWYNSLANTSDDHEPIEVGNLFLTANSQHLYEEHFEQAKKIVELYTVERAPFKSFPVPLENYEHPDMLLQDLFHLGHEDPIKCISDSKAAVYCDFFSAIEREAEQG